MILRVDAASPVPPYEQIRAQVASMIASGLLAPDTRLPPIRQLARDLGLATGTVARAYHELEVDGLVVAMGRHGTVVARDVESPDPAAAAARVEEAAASFATAARQHGASLDQALASVRAAFTGLDPSAPAHPREART